MNKHTRKIVTEKRISLGMSQQQVADKVGVSAKTISNFESGRTMPTVYAFKKLCKVLGLDPKELI